MGLFIYLTGRRLGEKALDGFALRFPVCFLFYMKFISYSFNMICSEMMEAREDPL